MIIYNNQLPYEVDEYCTVPADIAVGDTYEKVVHLSGCSYRRYMITVDQCVNEQIYEDGVCAGMNYEDHGFRVNAENLPAVGNTVTYTRTVMRDGCKNVTKLRLTVLQSDTTDYVFTIKETDLPYDIKVNEVVYFTVPVGTPLGLHTGVVKNPDAECAFIRYFVTINRVETGLDNLPDDIDRIEVFDCTGKLIQTFRGTVTLDDLDVPSGMYLLRVYTVSGRNNNQKVFITR